MRTMPHVLVAPMPRRVYCRRNSRRLRKTPSPSAAPPPVFGSPETLPDAGAGAGAGPFAGAPPCDAGTGAGRGAGATCLAITRVGSFKVPYETLYRCPVTTSTASAVMPSLNEISLPVWATDGVNDTRMLAEADCPGASWKLFHTTVDPLTAIAPVEADALTGCTSREMWLTTVCPKFRVWLPPLLTVSVMVQESGTPTVGGLAQVALWDTENGGGGGAVTVSLADAWSPSNASPAYDGTRAASCVCSRYVVPFPSAW